MSFGSAILKTGGQLLQFLDNARIKFGLLRAAATAAQGVEGATGVAGTVGRGLFGNSLGIGAGLNAGVLGTSLGAASTGAILGAATVAAGVGAGAGYLFNRYALGIDMEGNDVRLSPEQQRQREAIRANARARETVAVQDAFAPGGSMITTPQGGRMITSAQDSVIAAKEGGVLAQKLDVLISKIDGLATRPIMMDGKKVNSVLAESNRYNPFVA
jgi:hypothetical protein